MPNDFEIDQLERFTLGTGEFGSDFDSEFDTSYGSVSDSENEPDFQVREWE